MDSPSASSSTLIESLVNHVALPPRLPGKQDNRIEQIEQALTARLLDASRILRDLTDDSHRDQWDRLRRILETCKILNAGGKLSKSSLLKELQNLEHNDYLILHVSEQNAGLLIRRQNDEQGKNVIFEAFEASPRSEKVLGSGNTLQWGFPGCAVAISFADFSDPSFQDNLVDFLDQASSESIKRFAARTDKAGSSAFESRDTVEPTLITQILMTLLEANGHRTFPPILRKRIRDDVCWTDGAEKPWRRCPYWLVLRVGLQRQIQLGGEAGRARYKFLICLFIARLLDDALHLPPDLIVFLKAKLCRRLSKLEVDRDRAPHHVRTVYTLLFTKLGPIFNKSTETAIQSVEAAWTNLKRMIRRPVTLLPRRADQRDLYLSLPNSGLYLERVLAEPLLGIRHPVPYRLPARNDISAPARSNLRAFASLYFSLFELETKIKRSHADIFVFTEPNIQSQCIELARGIDTYLSTVAGAYDANPEQKSLMLLTAMESWMLMDQLATRIYSLLTRFNPGFPPEILDVLQLSSFQDMVRLQKIQNYLRDRHITSQHSGMTVFDDPTKGCFAELSFDNLEALQILHQRIETAAEVARTQKEKEWQKLSQEYEDMIKTVAESTCLFTTDENWPYAKVHDDRQCTKCFLERKSRRIKIRIHEHPLPSNLVQAKAVVFELYCPKAFSAYRDATWRLLGTLARPKGINYSEPRVLLQGYSELNAFRNSNTFSLSLASTTKSFLDSHYANVRFPVSLEDVCLPNGLKYGYFDKLTKVWPARQTQKPTFAHHCRMNIPKTSPFSSLAPSLDLAVDADGPSSYEIIASQTRCPPGLNVHEFMAYQGLFSGKNRRWPSILMELGSSNLNFGTEATALLISQLALQVGPACGADPLRSVHSIFRDVPFCERLLDQLGRRLDAISSNWRETNCMELLVSLMLRLCSLAPESSIVNAAGQLLHKTRMITYRWVSLLRAELQGATDAETSQKCSRYAFWASLLCRRTFSLHVQLEETLQPTALRCFLECSITLQDNLVRDPSSLPNFLRNAVVRDTKMVYDLRFLLRRSLEASPETLMTAINIVWPGPEGSQSRSSLELTFLPCPNEWWIQSIVDETQQNTQQILHYHLLQGTLLVDGKPLGKLPAEYRTSVILTELFGEQSLLTFPSGHRGMSYTLAIRMYGHQIHLGFRNDRLVIRACVRDKVLELIPREVFFNTTTFDLPASLVDECVHWLDLKTGIMEIRKKSNIWKSVASNWFVNVRTRQAHRRTVSLIDTQSPLFQKIARLFDRFEYRQYLTIFQPDKRSLSVELRRLELTFTVNRKGLLESPQLQSEVDPNQDAGTWYGLNSKLVLREVENASRRSIIVPLGNVLYKRNSFHVETAVTNDGSYGRFIINDTLGRLECATEPRLLYFKARLHAYTSFVLPDPLTGRTGTEESLHCLQSGYCQPWAPLNPALHQSLMAIANLTPKRYYYPENLKVMQKVLWDKDLTTTIQHDGYRSAIENIYKKSEQLSIFALQKAELPSLQPAGDLHLTCRNYSRHCLYERPNPSFDHHQEFGLTYDSRDCFKDNQLYKNVHESTLLIRNWSSQLSTSSDLAGILQNWTIIGGYDRSFDKILLSDRLTVQIPLEWGSLVNLCRQVKPKDKFRLMFLFAVVSASTDIDMVIVRTLIGFAIFEDLKPLILPKWPSYKQFKMNQIPHINYLLQLMKACCLPFAEEWNTLGLNIGPKQRRKIEMAKLAHEEQTQSDCKELARFLLEQWPCQEPKIEGFSRPVLLNIQLALDVIRPEWERLFYNIELSRHIQQVQLVLDRHCTEIKEEPDISKIPRSEEELAARIRGGELASLSRDLLSKACPEFVIESEIKFGDDKIPITSQGFTSPLAKLPNGLMPRRLHESTPRMPVEATTSSAYPELDELKSIIRTMSESRSTVRQQYGCDLMQSLTALESLKSKPKENVTTIDREALSAEIAKAREMLRLHFNQLRLAFERNDSRAQWLQKGGLWPSITPITLLEQLRSTSDTIYGERMKENLISYALSITTLQRLLRIENAYQNNNGQKLTDEHKNAGHSNWQPRKHPDWLLLEIDANMLIRPEQVDVALATIVPDSGSNSVLQMNMGQGKTSCIMPMIAAVLADTKQLLRVVVPKPLLLQTAQTLQSRCGGLLGREVRHVPFSRKTETKPDIIKAYHLIHYEILKSSSVLLSLPENILSFRLSGLQRLSDARITEAKQMIALQDWISQKCRDVLDECDVTLAVRTQLIYPSGAQKTVDGHPHRWEIAEALLGLVEGHLINLQHEYPRSIEVVRRTGGGFPFIYFLRGDAEDALVGRLVTDICSGRASIIPTRDFAKSDCLVIKKFISDAKVGQEIIRRVSQLFFDKAAATQVLYLLRGLLVHRILLLSLKKRWNVQYGVHPRRDPIAVPFHAKGVPSEQAEWGHPDVAILFTCLAFYYEGLNVEHLRQSLGHILKSDDPSSEYDRWTQNSGSSGLPDSLREWNAINVDDEAQLREIWQNVRYNVVVIDYFLNNFVFPKHAKQFQMKLQASGWDIPLISLDNKTQRNPKGIDRGSSAKTTGFSGTNDNRKMLPLTIAQEDLDGLSHTNAEVLTYLLQTRNRQYVLAADARGRRLSEQDLLRRLCDMGIRVLIDAGAQILEMDNLSLAKAWLAVDTEAPAAILFNTDNKAMVYYRHGLQIPLSASPFAENMVECLIYLDEAHTRGTDLKMPALARGALTLGQGQTKDHTVQAAMRLRHLATSQSVSFFAPPEVHQSILDLCNKQMGDTVDSHDVICWLLEQTCSGNEQLQPLYYSQGVDFCRRTQAAFNSPDFLANENQRRAYLDSLRQNEQQTLEQLYKPQVKTASTKSSGPMSADIAAYMKELDNRRKGFQDTGNAVQGSALQEVEQEREVAYEVEAIREVQRPIHYTALSFPGLHRDVASFAKTGRLAADSAGYEQAFVALSRMSLGQKHGIHSEATVSLLYVSTEFTKTIRLTLGQPNDNFQRNVNWILWSPLAETAVVIIPEEAELIIPLLRGNKTPTTHLLTYSAPVTRKMLHFNRLDYYAMPSTPVGWRAPTWLTIELGIFAGRLYFEYFEYDDMRRYLGLHPGDTATASLERIESEENAEKGVKDTDTRAGPVRSFTDKPLTFLHDWLTIRRKGQDFLHTPMGYICQGKSLIESHPFFTRSSSSHAKGAKAVVKAGSDMDRFSSDEDLPLDVADDETYFTEPPVIDLEEGEVIPESNYISDDNTSTRRWENEVNRSDSQPALPLRNGPLPEGFKALDCFFSDGLQLDDTKVVEIDNGDFLRIIHILQNQLTTEVFLQGRIFRRADAKGLRGLDLRLNEVVQIAEVELDDGRAEDDQSIEGIPLSKVLRLRQLILTNQPYPSFSVAEQRYQYRNATHAAAEGPLVCRWKSTTYFKNRKLREKRKVDEESLQVLTEEQSSKHYGVDDATLREIWRGVTIRGGACDGISLEEKRFNKEEKRAIRNLSTLHSSGRSHQPHQQRSTSADLLAEIDYLTFARSLNPTLKRRYTFGDCFCGVGGTSRGAKDAGYRVQWGFDFDATAINAYCQNFYETTGYGMAAHDFITIKDDVKVDVLHLGPPYQTLSPAHTIEGKNDDMNSASFLASREAIQKTKPRIVTFENTSGLPERHTLWMESLIDCFTSLEFSLRWKVLHFDQYGLPQNRKRLVLFASCPGEPLPDFPLPTHTSNPEFQHERGLAPCTTVNQAIAPIPANFPNHEPDEAMLRTAPSYDGDNLLPYTITTSGGGNIHPSGARDLTHRELACLQGFPLEHKFGLVCVKKQIGNAVPPSVAKVLLEHIKKALRKADGIELDR
ncbi:MAG: hypothetical protein M1819_003531 [Sarea resinae]|nr:MAG: hypothetical protein M1819_003531 [Sarea resinae]